MLNFYKIVLSKYSDKLLHFLVSFYIAMTFSAILPLLIAVGITVLIGLLKELWDKKHGGECSLYDFVADIIGVAMAILIFCLI